MTETNQTELTLSEVTRFQVCEEAIERGLATFIEVGTMLFEIRENRYYRATHATFEDYCQKRWGWRRDYADKQIRAAQVVLSLHTNVCELIPENEAQARELTALPPTLQAPAWEAAVEKANGEQPTQAMVKAAVAEIPSEIVAAERAKAPAKRGRKAKQKTKQRERRSPVKVVAPKPSIPSKPKTGAEPIAKPTVPVHVAPPSRRIAPSLTHKLMVELAALRRPISTAEIFDHIRDIAPSDASPKNNASEFLLCAYHVPWVKIEHLRAGNQYLYRFTIDGQLKELCEQQQPLPELNGWSPKEVLVFLTNLRSTIREKRSAAHAERERRNWNLSEMIKHELLLLIEFI